MAPAPRVYPVVLRCLGKPVGGLGAHYGRYLQSMDFTRSDGLVTTADINLARMFPSVVDAFDYMRTVPDCHPVRESDGEPNRPLRAWSWEFRPHPSSPLAGGAKSSE